VLEFGGQATTSVQPHSSWVWMGGRNDTARRNKKPYPKYIQYTCFLLVL
jgi:hypothetical protein